MYLFFFWGGGGGGGWDFKFSFAGLDAEKKIYEQ